MRKLFTFYIVFFFVCLHLSAQNIDWETKFKIDTVENLTGYDIKLFNDKILVAGLSQGEEMGSYFCSLLSFSKDGNNQWYKIIKKEKPNFTPALGIDDGNIAVYSARPIVWSKLMYGKYTLQTDIFNNNGHDVFKNNDTTVLSDLDPGCFIPLDNKVVYFSHKSKDSVMSYMTVSRLDKEGKFIDKTIIDSAIWKNVGGFYPKGVCEIADGGVMLFGDNEYGKYFDRRPFLLKLDKDLKKQWVMTFSDSTYSVFFQNVKQLPDGYLILADVINVMKNTRTYKAIFIDDTGKVKRVIPLSYKNDFIYNDFAMDNNGNYFFVGCQNCDKEDVIESFVVEKRNADMDTVWTKVYNTDMNDKQIMKIIKDDDGSYVIVGDYNRQLYLARFRDNTSGAGDIASSENSGSTLGNSPNPFECETSINYTLSSAGNVRLSVVDVFGRIVSEMVNGYMDSGSHNARYQSGDNPAGVYYLVLDVNGRKTTSKMVIIK